MPRIVVTAVAAGVLSIAVAGGLTVLAHRTQPAISDADTIGRVQYAEREDQRITGLTALVVVHLPGVHSHPQPDPCRRLAFRVVFIDGAHQQFGQQARQPVLGYVGWHKNHHAVTAILNIAAFSRNPRSFASRLQRAVHSTADLQLITGGPGGIPELLHVDQHHRDMLPLHVRQPLDSFAHLSGFSHIIKLTHAHRSCVSFDTDPAQGTGNRDELAYIADGTF